MWEFYLISCELGFRFDKQMVFQMQLIKSVDGLPLTRDYMAKAEGTLNDSTGGLRSGGGSPRPLPFPNRT